MLRLLCEDHTLKEIAGAMHRSESAIDTKIKTLKEKLGRKTLAGLAAFALRHGLI